MPAPDDASALAMPETDGITKLRGDAGKAKAAFVAAKIEMGKQNQNMAKARAKSDAARVAVRVKRREYRRLITEHEDERMYEAEYQVLDASQQDSEADYDN